MLRIQALLILVVFTLMGCEGQVSVELAGTPPEDVSAARLQIESLTLLSDSANDVELSLSTDSSISFLSLGRGRSLNLISSDDVPTGNYTAIRLNLTAEASRLDSYITENDEDVSLSLAGNSSTVNYDFSIKEDEDLRLRIYFDLRSSLALNQDADGNLELRPRLLLANSADTGFVAGDISTELLSSNGCDTDDRPETGEVVYAFSGIDTQADELDRSAPEPIASALISRDAVGSDYVIGPLPQGGYTLAITCEANLDDPDADDAIRFILSQAVDVVAESTTSLNFE